MLKPKNSLETIQIQDLIWHSVTSLILFNNKIRDLPSIGLILLNNKIYFYQYNQTCYLDRHPQDLIMSNTLANQIFIKTRNRISSINQVKKSTSNKVHATTIIIMMENFGFITSYKIISQYQNKIHM